MVYSTGSHSVYYHRYHVVWATKYRYDVLRGELRLRIREIIRQVCRELNVEIVKGVLSTDHVHMFIAVPPKVSISQVIQRMKGRSSYRIQQEFPAIRKRYWGRHFWAKGYFSTTSGNITDDVILQMLWGGRRGDGTLVAGNDQRSLPHGEAKRFEPIPHHP